ncbi:sigma factor-like helix-turn-helix DNA-binding protein [Ktedonobacter robiniae]|uniref:sigma factor-like helix-turn-helix DNA-binding protein n=1 Tax=Ktedonobacter robiniae TaxID=2778365 RepID=UPI0019159026
MVSGEPHTLEQVAQTFSLSRERIRQVVERSLHKIKHKGKRELAQGKTPSNRLVLILHATTLPGQAINRLVVRYVVQVQ